MCAFALPFAVVGVFAAAQDSSPARWIALLVGALTGVPIGVYYLPKARTIGRLKTRDRIAVILAAGAGPVVSAIARAVGLVDQLLVGVVLLAGLITSLIAVAIFDRRAMIAMAANRRVRSLHGN